MNKPTGNWVITPDENIRQVWQCDCKAEEVVDPSSYADVGVPFCTKCETSMSYVGTLVKTLVHTHVWTPLAPEIEVDNESPMTWKWCIRCGKLKLGRMIFSPGPDQKLSIKEDKP